MKKFLFFTLCSLLTSSAMAALSSTETRIVNHIDNTNPQAVELLEHIVNINSGTMNFAGVRNVANVLIPEFKKLGFKAHFEEGTTFNRAGHLIAELQSGKGPKILLIGHLDTVFEADSPFQQFELLDNNQAKGPGISDMKGGDIIILQSLKALKDAGELADMNIKVVMTGDEELSGRPLALSKKALIDAAEWADIAIGFEGGDGKAVTANISRRGTVDWTLTVKGNAAHSSQVFSDEVGAGAIYEVSRILHRFYQELRSESLLTFNPGRIMGGTTVEHDKANNSGSVFGKNNVVAQSAIVTGDIRSLSLQQLTRVENKMRSIVAEHLPQTEADISFGEGYPPMAPSEGNKKLLSLYSRISQDLGQGEVVAVNPLDAGAADVSFTAEFVDMAIDGLGLSGSGGHTVEERADLNALSAQTKRAALLLYRLKYR
ncbi:M20/M25/M40 family metallo-hydrolase [Neptunicella sp. SCSIO 80796]|uniref:M20/M25/M40 family metallo-hydrolase n=1 Tax=Neptunicella plasticusilytica TaxID=3117012 RepID=UPI003A4DA95F